MYAAMSDLQANTDSKFTFEVQVKCPGTNMQHPPSLNSVLHTKMQPVFIIQLGGVWLLPREEIIQTLTTLNGSSKLKTSKKLFSVHGKSMGI